MKGRMALSVLEAGFSVVMVDSDQVFFKNPLLYIDPTVHCATSLNFEGYVPITLPNLLRGALSYHLLC